MSNWSQVAKLSEIPKLGSRVVEIDDMRIAIFRTSEDQVFALEDSCPHKKGPLSQGMVHGTSVTCPLHNWKIDLANGQALGADKGCTGSYPTRIEEDVVYIKLG